MSAALKAARDAWQRGDATGAQAQCRALLDADPRDAAAWTLLGIILRRTDPVGARAALETALVAEPGSGDAAFHLGNLFREQQRNDEAIEAYRLALAAAPDHPSILNNLALAEDAQGKLEQARAGYEAVLRRVPNHRQALANLVHLLCRMRRYEDAANAAARFLRVFPDGELRVWIDYGICQHYAGDYAGAETSFRRALAEAPDDVIALTNLGSVLIDRGAYEAADPILSRAVAAGDDFCYPAALLAYCRANLCAWTGLDALYRRVRDGLAAGDRAINAFAALSMPLTSAEQLAVARQWAADLAPVTAIVATATNLSGNRAASAGPVTAHGTRARLRLGYVSSDFRSHPTTFLLAEVWERHDRERVETFAYSIGPREATPLRARVEAAFTRFHDCLDDSIEQTVARIRADEIDVLIDLNGYTTHARSTIFAARAAPLQMHWLGHLGTLGAEHIDCVLTDRVATPEDEQPFFTERLLYLPDCYCPSDTRRAPGSRVPTRQQSGLPEDGFVFCCFNNEYKITPAVFDVWMRLLDRVDRSVLWLAPGSVTAAENLRREAAARGVDAQRLRWAPRVPLADHLARHALVDLFLDTLPYNAGATANDALLMGVPVLTCMGTTMAGRVAASQLRAIGLDDMVTHSLDDYESRALALAQQADALAAVRRRLHSNRATHPLFDMQRFTRNLEDVLQQAWTARTGA